MIRRLYLWRIMLGDIQLLTFAYMSLLSGDWYPMRLEFIVSLERCYIYSNNIYCISNLQMTSLNLSFAYWMDIDSHGLLLIFYRNLFITYMLWNAACTLAMTCLLDVRELTPTYSKGGWTILRRLVSFMAGFFACAPLGAANLLCEPSAEMKSIAESWTTSTPWDLSPRSPV